MRTKLDYSSLGESKGTYSSTKGVYGSSREPNSSRGMSSGDRETSSSTNSSVRQMKEKWMGSSSSKQKGGSAASVAMGLLAGAGVGVLAGILMAPDKGTTTRRRVADSASWVGRGITEAFGNKGKMNSWIGKGESGNKSQGSFSGESNF